MNHFYLSFDHKKVWNGGNPPMTDTTQNTDKGVKKGQSKTRTDYPDYAFYFVIVHIFVIVLV